MRHATIPLSALFGGIGLAMTAFALRGVEAPAELIADGVLGAVTGLVVLALGFTTGFDPVSRAAEGIDATMSS